MMAAAASSASSLWARSLQGLAGRAWMCSLSSRFPHVCFHKEVKVVPFGGSLWATSPLQVKVTPLGPPEHPNMDRAFVKVRSVEQSPKEPSEVPFTVSQQGHKLEVAAVEEVVKNNFASDLSQSIAEIKIPMVYSVNVAAELTAGIEAEDFIESKYCTLKSQSGDISATRIKSERITLESESGNVYCMGNLQGNVSIETSSGNVVADRRFTGPTLDITTDSGDIQVAASYSESSKFSTNTGNLNLRNLHNESYIAIYEQGNCKVQGIDGGCNIFVKKGDVDVHISQLLEESRIHVEEGDVTLKISDTKAVKIGIDANDIIPDAKFSSHGKVEACDRNVGQKHYFCAVQPNSFSPSIYVFAENGNVVLESEDWAASLGLKVPLPKDDATK